MFSHPWGAGIWGYFRKGISKWDISEASKGIWISYLRVPLCVSVVYGVQVIP